MDHLSAKNIKILYCIVSIAPWVVNIQIQFKRFLKVPISGESRLEEEEEEEEEDNC